MPESPAIPGFFPVRWLLPVLGIWFYPGLDPLLSATGGDTNTLDFQSVPPPEVLLMDLSRIDGYGSAVGKRQVVQNMYMLLARISSDHAIAEAFGRPSRLTPEQAGRVQTLAGAYSTVSNRLLQNLTREERATLTNEEPAIRIFLVRHHLPEYERLYPGSLASWQASVGSSTILAEATSEEKETESHWLDSLPVDDLLMAYAVLASSVILLLFLIGVWKVLVDRDFSFDLNSYRATVVSERQWSETEIKMIYGESSKTTRYQQAFIRLHNGRELKLDMVDQLFPCRPGHELTIFEVARYAGGYRACAYYNHTTDDILFFPSRIRKALERAGIPFIFWSLLITCLLTAFLLGLVIFFFLMLIIASLRMFRAWLRVPLVKKAVLKKLADGA